MAEDWIKMRADLYEREEVVYMASLLKIDVYSVVGRLHKLWAWADSNTADGKNLRITFAWIDDFVSQKNFAISLQKAGWLKGKDGAISIPKFEKHNGSSAKKRAESNLRVAIHREKNRKQNGNRSVTQSETEKPLRKALPEKRRIREDSISSSSGRENTETPKSPFIPGAVFEGPFTMPWGTQSPEGLARCKLTKFDEAEGEAEFEELDTGDRWCCFGSRFDRVKSRQRTPSG